MPIKSGTQKIYIIFIERNQVPKQTVTWKLPLWSKRRNVSHKIEKRPSKNIGYSPRGGIELYKIGTLEHGQYSCGGTRKFYNKEAIHCSKQDTLRNNVNRVSVHSVERTFERDKVSVLWRVLSTAACKDPVCTQYAYTNSIQVVMCTCPICNTTHILCIHPG